MRETQKVNTSRDESLLDELPSDVNVHRTSLVDPYDNLAFRVLKKSSGRRKTGSSQAGPDSERASSRSRNANLDFIHALLVPDRMIGWLPFAVAKGISVVRKARPSVIYSTSPCETAHLVGVILSRMFSIPLVTDFRDPWTAYYFALRRPRLVERLNLWMERTVLRESARVVSTTAECSESLQDMVRREGDGKFSVITNGYDEDDFRGIEPRSFDRFTIVFTGTVYRQAAPRIVFQALKEMKDEGHPLDETIQFIFVGRQYPEFDHLIRAFGLEDVVKRVDYLPHRDSIAYLMGADACYYNVFSELAITAKLFEYLRSGTPIIAAISKDHSAARIIERCDAGFVVGVDDTAAIRASLNVLMRRARSNERHDTSPPNRNIMEFERRKLASSLSDVLRDVAGRSRRVR